MKAFLVIVFSALGSVWIARDTRRRRGAHKALNFMLLYMMGVWILFWSWPLVEDTYTWWATGRVSTREIAPAAPAALIESPNGMALRVNFRNNSPAHTVDRLRLGLRLLDCPEPAPSFGCDELHEAEFMLRVWAHPGRETGPIARPLTLPAGFHIRHHLIVDVTVLEVRNRK